MRCLVRALLILLLLVVVGVAAGVALWGDGPRLTFDEAELRQLISAELGTDAPVSIRSASVGLGGAELADVDLVLASGLEVHIERVDLEGVDWAGLAERTRLAADLLVLQGVTFRIELSDRPTPTEFQDGLRHLSSEWGSGSLERMEATDATVLVLQGGTELARLEQGTLSIDELAWTGETDALLTQLDLGFTAGSPCDRLRVTWSGSHHTLGAEAHASAIAVELVRALMPTDVGVEVRAGQFHELSLLVRADEQGSEAHVELVYDELDLALVPRRAPSWALPLGDDLVRSRGRVGDPHRAHAEGGTGAEELLVTVRRALVHSVTAPGR